MNPMGRQEFDGLSGVVGLREEEVGYGGMRQTGEAGSRRQHQSEVHQRRWQGDPRTATVNLSGQGVKELEGC